MSLLVVKLPPRQRLGSRAAGSEPAAGPRGGAQLPAQWDHVFSADGRQAGPLRQAATALLPKADSVVLVLAAADVSWHRLLVPKATPARMAAALGGMMEERLLDDEAAVHLALAPDAVPGREGWAAATHGPRLAAALAALEAAGHSVERVVTPLPPPGPGLRGHFALHGEAESQSPAGLDAGAGDTAGAALTDGGEPFLCLSRDDGVWSLPLLGAAGPGLAAALRTSLAENGPGQRWTTTPAAALAAERYLGRPVPLQTEAENLLEAAQMPAGGPQRALNLRQFSFVSQNRGLRAVGAVGKRLLSAEWRLARYGVVAVLALQLLGLNAYAWQQKQALQARRAAIDNVLRTTHPGVRTVLDAPAQMAAETERLRAAAGRAGGADLEVALAAAAAAWPDGKGPVGNFRYESGRLVLAAPGWQPPEVTAMRDRLRPAGWTVEWAEGRLTLAQARAGTATAGAPGAPL
jgi:general secretion pathway protein L